MAVSLSDHLTLPSNWSDVEYVLEHLSAQNQEEADLMMWSKKDLAHKMAEFMAGALETNTLWLDGKPAIVFSVANSEEFGPVTWFVATKDFFGRGLFSLQWCRLYLRDTADRFGGLSTICAGNRPKALKWMRLFGYEEHPRDGYTLFRMKA